MCTYPKRPPFFKNSTNLSMISFFLAGRRGRGGGGERDGSDLNMRMQVIPGFPISRLDLTGRENLNTSVSISLA